MEMLSSSLWDRHLEDGIDLNHSAAITVMFPPYNNSNEYQHLYYQKGPDCVLFEPHSSNSEWNAIHKMAGNNKWSITSNTDRWTARRVEPNENTLVPRRRQSDSPPVNASIPMRKFWIKFPKHDFGAPAAIITYFWIPWQPFPLNRSNQIPLGVNK